MLQHITPGKANLEEAKCLDLTIQPLLAAASAGEPLEPAMQSIVRSFGFDSFVYAVTTVAQPNRDSRSYTWTTLPREWVALYDKNAMLKSTPESRRRWGVLRHWCGMLPRSKATEEFATFLITPLSTAFVAVSPCHLTIPLTGALEWVSIRRLALWVNAAKKRLQSNLARS